MIRPLAAIVTFLTLAAAPDVACGTHRAGDTLHPLDANGYAKMVAAHHGHILIVDFWATWCSPCREEMPGIVALARQYDKDGIRLVTVSADDPAQMRAAKRFLDSVHAPAARYVKRSKDDGAFIAAIDTAWTGALPTLFVYDRVGRKVRALFGETAVDTLTAVVRAATIVR